MEEMVAPFLPFLVFFPYLCTRKTKKHIKIWKTTVAAVADFKKNEVLLKKTAHNERRL